MEGRQQVKVEVELVAKLHLMQILLAAAIPNLLAAGAAGLTFRPAKAALAGAAGRLAEET